MSGVGSLCFLIIFFCAGMLSDQLVSFFQQKLTYGSPRAAHVDQLIDQGCVRGSIRSLWVWMWSPMGMGWAREIGTRDVLQYLRATNKFN